MAERVVPRRARPAAGAELYAAAGSRGLTLRPYAGGTARFRVAAVAPDGVIEAIESIDNGWFCVGVQWHPEADSASALDLQLFEAMVQASIRQAQPLEMAA